MCVCGYFIIISLTGAIALGGAYFGEGKGPIFLDDTECSPDNHTFLQECFESANAATIGQHNCDHSEDVSVVCPGIIIRASFPNWNDYNNHLVTFFTHNII